MKKFILITLTLLYAVVSSGITINFHYCMGRLADVEWGSASVCASCGEKKMTSHCCKDEAHYVKLAVDQDVNHVPVTNLLPAVTELLPVMYSAFIPLRQKVCVEVLLLSISHLGKQIFRCLFIIVLI